MTRLKNNMKLLEILKNIIENNPDLRFGQILYVFGFIDHIYDKICDVTIIKDPFAEEPNQTLERVNQCLKNYGQK